MGEEPSKDGAAQRRSTRIEHAVPIVVTGVDALGQFYKERTTTVAINCHGCRYQSRHFTLKGTSVSVEIAGTEPGIPPRSVKARVVENTRLEVKGGHPFLVDVEMDNPANIWGLAFPPEDWANFPDLSPGIPSSAIKTAPAAPAAPSTPAPTPAAPENKIHTMPRPVERKPAADRPWDTASVHKEPPAAPSLPPRPADTQSSLAAELTAEAGASPGLTRALAEAIKEIKQAGSATAEAFREQWNRELAKDLSDLRRKMAAGLAEMLEGHRQSAAEDIQQEVARVSNELAAIEQRAQALASSLAGTAPDQLEQLRKDMQAAVADVRLEVNLLRAELQARPVEPVLIQQPADLPGVEPRELAAQVAAQARAEMKGQFEIDLASFRSRFAELMESLSAEGQQRVSLGAEQAAADAERAVAAHVEGAREAFGRLQAQASESVQSLQESLEAVLVRGQAWQSQFDAREEQLKQRLGEFDSAQRRAAEELDRQADQILSGHAAKLETQAESLLSRTVAGMHTSLEQAGQQMVARFSTELEGQLQPWLERASRSLEETSQRIVHQAAVAQQNKLQQAGEQVSADLAARLKQAAQGFDESCQNSLNGWLEKLDAKATELTHNTFESLYKTSEWYQNKAQTAMQSTADKILQQTANGLQAKAAELSRLFASELDQYSRSYVEHTRELTEENVNDLVQNARQRLGRQVDDTITKFIADMRRTVEEHSRFLAESASEEFLGQYKQSLENVTNAWLLASAAQLTQRSQAALDIFARGVEDRLRQGASTLFAALASSLIPQQPAKPGGEEVRKKDPSKKTA